MHRVLWGRDDPGRAEAGLEVVEVNQPNRFDRRLRGKTDILDAYSATEAVPSGRVTAAPEGGDALVEALRVLRTSRSSALTASRPGSSPVTAPEATCDSLRQRARRWQMLTEQINDLARHLERLLLDHAPALMAAFGTGRDTVARRIAEGRTKMEIIRCLANAIEPP